MRLSMHAVPKICPVLRQCISVIAVSGLGGHAYGSFKDKNGNYMWLQDALSSDLINVQTGRSMARIMIYGHKSTVPGSRSVQDIDDLATALHSNLLALVEGQRTRPIILMGHSLGGLIVKKVSEVCHHMMDFNLTSYFTDVDHAVQISQSRRPEAFSGDLRDRLLWCSSQGHGYCFAYSNGGRWP